MSNELIISKGVWVDTSYESLLDEVFASGQYRPDRTGTGAYSTFGKSLRFNMNNGLPVVTTKRVHLKSIIGELLWFLSGSTNALELEEEYGVTIWREWMDADGELGPVYGQQWVNWGGKTSPDGVGIDQISNVIKSLKTDPFGRRHIVSAWNPADIPDMALPPCHMMFQFFVSSDADGKPAGLSLSLYQRSADMFLGVPYNITSYAILLAMVAQEVGMEPQELLMTFGDAHIYSNHFDAVEEQMQMTDRAMLFPALQLDPVESIFDHDPSTIHVTDYKHGPTISAPVSA